MANYSTEVSLMLSGSCNNEGEPVYNSLPPMTSAAEPPTTSTSAKPVPPSAMAFTVDFGQGDEADERDLSTEKRLGLKDGIGRFAPAKKMRDKPKSPRAANKLNPSHKEDVMSLSQTTTNNVNTIVSSSSAKKIEASKNNYQKIPGKGDPSADLGRKSNLSRSLNEKSAKKETLVVDEENNIAAGDAGSDAGTYTIDNEEEGDKSRLSVNGDNKPKNGVFGSLNDEKINTQDWVNMWAANNTLAMSHQREKAEEEYEDDFEDDDDDEEEESSLSSVREGTSESRSRRKLPATPQSVRKTTHTLSSSVIEASKCDKADDYLKDTLSLMASMEARISSNNESERKPKPKPATKTSSNKSPTSASKPSPPAGSAASIEAANKAKELEAWKRRKNYDPLKSVGKKPTAAPPARPGRSHDLDDSYSEDTCSDLDVRSQRSTLTTNARTNRAFALRHSSSLQAGNDALSPKNSPKRQPPSQESFSRNDGGRWSLRNKNGVAAAPPCKPAVSSSVHRMPHVMKKSPAMKAAVQGGRSTSSLSSKEAEFQAWKRRKNYDPLRSAQSAVPKRSTTTKPNSAPIKRGDILPARGGGGSVVTSNHSPSHQRVLSSANHPMMQDNLLRSASFHYPDGMSKVQLNVYTSEDDDESQLGEFPSGLYEVNEDELILAIGGSAANNGPSSLKSEQVTSPSHWQQHKPRNSPSRASGGASKLEALDNLVISTIFSISTKLCLTSGKVIRRLQEQTEDKEHVEYLDTLVSYLKSNNDCYFQQLFFGTKKREQRFAAFFRPPQ